MKRVGFNHQQIILLPHGTGIGNSDQFVWLLSKRRKTGNSLSREILVREVTASAALASGRKHGFRLRFLAHVQVTTQLCITVFHDKPWQVWPLLMKVILWICILTSLKFYSKWILTITIDHLLKMSMIGILGKDQEITNKENVEVETVNEPFGIFFLHDMKIY